MADHGAMLKGPLHFMGLTRVPFLWSEPSPVDGGAAAVPVVGSVCGSIDIARTILTHAGATVYNGIQGRDLAPLMAGAAAPADSAVQIQSETARLVFGRPAPYRLLSLVQQDWRLTFSTDEGMCELYDLKADPHELVNLWSDPAHRTQRAELMERLLRETMLSGERSPLPVASG